MSLDAAQELLHFPERLSFQRRERRRKECRDAPPILPFLRRDAGRAGAGGRRLGLWSDSYRSNTAGKLHAGCSGYPFTQPDRNDGPDSPNVFPDGGYSG